MRAVIHASWKLTGQSRKKHKQYKYLSPWQCLGLSAESSILILGCSKTTWFTLEGKAGLTQIAGVYGNKLLRQQEQGPFRGLSENWVGPISLARMSTGTIYVLLMVNYFSRFLWAKASTKHTAAKVLDLTTRTACRTNLWPPPKQYTRMIGPLVCCPILHPLSASPTWSRWFAVADTLWKSLCQWNLLLEWSPFVYSS